MPKQIKKFSGAANVRDIRAFSDKLVSLSTSDKVVTQKETKTIGDKYVSLLCKTANETGFEIERKWDGKIYKVNVVIPKELRGAYENYRTLFEMTVDMEDINKTLRELDESALVTKGSPLRKPIFLLGYLESAYDGIKRAIAEMENSVSKKPKLLKK